MFTITLVITKHLRDVHAFGTGLARTKRSQRGVRTAAASKRTGATRTILDYSVGFQRPGGSKTLQWVGFRRLKLVLDR